MATYVPVSMYNPKKKKKVISGQVKRHSKQAAKNVAKSSELLDPVVPRPHFSVNINAQHVSCSECNLDMIRLPSCRQFQPSLQLHNVYDCVTCSKYSVACTSNCINCLPFKGFSWKCQNFNCAQFTIHCNWGRLTYQDLKTKYKCPCGYEFEYDIEAGVETY